MRLPGRGVNYCLFAALLPVVFLSGCVFSHKISAHIPQASESKPVPLHVALLLPDDLCRYRFTRQRLGDWHIFKLGPALCQGTKDVARAAFSQVTVTNVRSTATADALLIPKIVSVDHFMPMTAWEQQEAMIVLEWTLTAGFRPKPLRTHSYRPDKHSRCYANGTGRSIRSVPPQPHHRCPDSAIRRPDPPRRQAEIHNPIGETAGIRRLAPAQRRMLIGYLQRLTTQHLKTGIAACLKTVANLYQLSIRQTRTQSANVKQQTNRQYRCQNSPVLLHLVPSYPACCALS